MLTALLLCCCCVVRSMLESSARSKSLSALVSTGRWQCSRCKRAPLCLQHPRATALDASVTRKSCRRRFAGSCKHLGPLNTCCSLPSVRVWTRSAGLRPSRHLRMLPYSKCALQWALQRKPAAPGMRQRRWDARLGLTRSQAQVHGRG